MTGVRFADVRARPAEFLNLTSLTLEEFEALVAPFEAAFQDHSGVAPRWETPNRPSLHRLSDLPAVNAGRSAVLPAHLPEDLHRSSGPGAAVRHEPEQSHPVDPCPAAGVARGAPQPRRCPRPLRHGSGAPAGCLRLAVSEGPLAPLEEPAPSPASAPIAGQGSPLVWGF
jgi:hypothetical protein